MQDISAENVGKKRRIYLQIRHIRLLKQLSDLTGLRKHFTAIQEPRPVQEPEVMIGSSAEHRKRRQGQARGNLRVDSIRQTDATVAERRRGGTSWKTHRSVNR